MAPLAEPLGRPASVSRSTGLLGVSSLSASATNSGARHICLRGRIGVAVPARVLDSHSFERPVTAPAGVCLRLPIKVR